MSIHWLGYAGTALVIVAYLPQIAHLFQEHCSAGISARAYLLWSLSAVLLLTYAIAIGDPVFIALQGYQAIATTTIYFYSKRFQYSACEIHVGKGSTANTS